MTLELIFRDTCAHRRSAANASCHHRQAVVDEVGTTPFLVSDNVNLALHLGLLDELSICTHALFGESRGKLV